MAEKRIIQDCNANTCQYHALTESVVRDLKEAVQKVSEGQDQMRETVIHLTEAFKAMERIDKRMEKLEDATALRDKEQDIRIDELRVFMYKALGALAAIGTGLAFLMKFAGILLV